MYLRSRISIVVLLALLCMECGRTKSKVQWPHGVKYEIFVLSFADSNGDGKGDINGVTNKLDYISELGINGLWLMPIMPSPSYHKYDVSDYRSIHADYGTMDDFRKLVDEAHQRGIKIIIDFVLNHTARNHPWFIEASKSVDSPYRDYYVWNDLESVRDKLSKKETSLDSDNITQWHAVNNDTLSEHYYGFFSSHMPDLNFDNEKVRQEFVDIARFWLIDVGVDGFRFDAARHIYPDDRPYDNHQFWKWYREELIKIKPDVYLVGEVYSVNTAEVAPYTKGLPALFNFYLGQEIINSINTGGDYGLVNNYIKTVNSYRLINPDFLDATILTNHDQNRIMSQLGEDKKKARVAASILLTLPGTPYLYYGEELGMKGIKPDEQIREPFLWGDSTIETKAITPKYSTSENVKPLKLQLGEKNSLFHHYKQLIALRNSNAPLTQGEIKPVNRLPKEVIGFMRVTSGESVAVFHNISGRSIAFSLEADLMHYKSILWTSGSDITVKDDIVTLPAYASVILNKY